MDLPPSSSQTATVAEEWELCNDDGFIHKREKRRRGPTGPEPLPADPEEEEKRRRVWKRKNLFRVKEKYDKEIEQWEVLEKTLKAMQERALGFQFQQRERRKLRETASFSESENIDKDEKYNSSGSSVDELLLRAEAHEMIIRDVSNLCDIAEAMFNAHEEQLKQFYFDLHVWALPRDLMASLCDEARNCARASLKV